MKLIQNRIRDRKNPKNIKVNYSYVSGLLLLRIRGSISNVVLTFMSFGGFICSYLDNSFRIFDTVIVDTRYYTRFFDMYVNVFLTFSRDV